MDKSNTILVIGAGHQGLTMAAHLSLNGETVNLWNRTEKHISALSEDGVVHCHGIFEGDGHLNLVSSDIEMVISDTIMITTPSTAHKEIAKKLAPYVTEDMVIVLNPGRTFGAIEFAEVLKQNGVTVLPHIAETQTIVYTCRKIDPVSVKLYALKNNVEIASIRNDDIDFILGKIPLSIRSHLKAVDSVCITSFSNVGMILHCAPVLMNIGWIESDKVVFKYYYDGISPTIAQYLEEMDYERCNIAKAMGYVVPTVKEWLKITYDSDGDTLFDALRNNNSYKEIDAPPTINTRYVFEDVPNGLVPIEAIANQLEIRIPAITTIIDLACYIMNTDYRQIGRTYSISTLSNYS